MIGFRAGSRRGRVVLVGVLLMLAAAVFPSAAAATPSYQGGASAGWGWQEGDVLTANPGTWTSTGAITYGYAWFNENSDRLGTGSTYTVTGSDVGHQIYAAITASDGSAPALTVNTPTVGPMHYRPPVNIEQPSVSGPWLAGSALVATPGKWVSGGSSTAPIQISYAWYRNCTAGPNPDCSNSGTIGDASSLLLTSADLGRTISLTVTASYPDGTGGQASSSFWLNLGPIIGSSVMPGATLTGIARWTVNAPGAQTVVFSIGATEIAAPADTSGAATLALDTTRFANGSTNLALTVTWKTGTAPVTTQIGSVTIANRPLAPPLRPLIAKPTMTPTRPIAGKRLHLTFVITRSDNQQPLRAGKMVCDPSVHGKVIPHTESFANGTARLAFTVPKTAKHELLKIKLTIELGSQSTTRTATFHIR